MSTQQNSWTLALGGAVAGAAACVAFFKWSHRDGDAKTAEKAILERRSLFLQDLNGEAVPDAAIERMLEAANWAPTHGQTQPWRFTVFRRSTGEVEKFFKLQMTSSEAKMQNEVCTADELAALQKFVKKQPKKAKDFAKCSHIIAISMKRKADPDKIMPEWEELAAVSCAVQNAHILACQLGVAMYWTSGGTEGPLNTDEVRTLLGLEDGDKCLGLMCIGRADPDVWEKSQSRATRGPAKDKTVWL